MSQADTKLDKATIEHLLGVVDHKCRLGKVHAAQEVSYPIKEIDIVEAIIYILERDVIGNSFACLDSSKNNGTNLEVMSYKIPIGDRTKYGRTTPRILLTLGPRDDDSLSGRLFHTYEGENAIIYFLDIPRKEPSNTQ